MKIYTGILLVLYQPVSILAMIFLPFIALYRSWRGKKTFGNLAERCGWMPRPPHNKPVIWIHAVSVGEILSVETLVQSIMAAHPESSCYITCGTSTGYACAHERQIGHHISFAPFDCVPFILLAFLRIRPQTVIIIESEWWPNMLAAAHLFARSLLLVNARLHEPLTHVRKLFSRALVPLFSHIYTQSTHDTRNFIALGSNPNRITTLGTTKSENVLQKHAQHIAAHSTRSREHLQLPEASHLQTHHAVTQLHIPSYRTILVGSLHPGELALYLDAAATLKATHPTLRWILVPRHFEWQSQLRAELDTRNILYSWWDTGTQRITVDTAREALMHHEMLIVCQMGVLFSLYELAEIFCLGGTFVPIGGHNLLEPAAWSLPIIVGPYYHHNTATVTELRAHEALCLAQSSSELFHSLNMLLRDTQQSQKMGTKAHRWLRSTAKHTQESTRQLIASL